MNRTHDETLFLARGGSFKHSSRGYLTIDELRLEVSCNREHDEILTDIDYVMFHGALATDVVQQLVDGTDIYDWAGYNDALEIPKWKDKLNTMVQRHKSQICDALTIFENNTLFGGCIILFAYIGGKITVHFSYINEGYKLHKYKEELASGVASSGIEPIDYAEIVYRYNSK